MYLKKNRCLVVIESDDSRSGSDLHCSRTASGAFSDAEIWNGWLIYVQESSVCLWEQTVHCIIIINIIIIIICLRSLPF